VRESEAVGFLTSPLRGFLAIMVVLGGVAVAMFYMHDEERGTFDRFPRGTGFSFSVAYHSSAVVMVSAVMLAAVLIMRASRGVGYEVLVLAIYSAAVLGFCMCLRIVVCDVRIFGALAPILIIVMVVISPILYPAPSLLPIQLLVPPYYYLCALTKVAFLWYMLAYAVFTLALAYFLNRIFSKRRRR
jgi:hypothetical protein